MARERKKSVLVTFKPKDKRPDKGKDKVELVRSATKTDAHFFTAEDMSRGPGVPSGMAEEMIGYDVNEYEAPIVMASLTKSQIEALKKNRNVASVEDDGLMYALDGWAWSAWGPGAGVGVMPPSAPRATLAPPTVVEGQPAVLSETIPAGVHQIRASAAWDCTRGKAVKVAVLDTGIDAGHPDLQANVRGGASFVTDESTPMDYNSHGTHAAGTIGAALNGSGVVGVAPSVYLYAVKVLSRTGAGNWSWLVAGIDWCINKKGIHIISMSLGGPSAPTAVERICEAAWKKGVLLIAAAGNTGPPTSGKSSVGAPARYDSVIAVSAIDSSNQIAPFSSRGPEVELAAPGVDVLSTIPGGGYGKKSGTSMACPHVTGAAALAWGTHRYADNVTIRRLLAWRADNLGIPGRDPDFGYGRVDAEQVACEMSEPPAIKGIP